MAEVTRLHVKITGDNADLKRSLKDSEHSVSRFSQFLKGLAAMAAGAFAATEVIRAAGQFIKSSIEVASHVEEMRSKFNTVFKSMAGDVEKWAAVNASAMSRSKYEFMEYLATLQDTFVPMGFARAEAAKFSKELTKLAVDVASFNDKAEPEVLRDFQSAIVGNHETVRKYGIVITQAALDAELMAMGIKKSANEASEAEKVMARYNLILNGTEDAHGDAIRTADSLANRTKAMRAAYQDLQVELGNELIPVWGEVVAGFTQVIKFGPFINDIISGMTQETIELVKAQVELARQESFIEGLRQKSITTGQSMIQVIDAQIASLELSKGTNEAMNAVFQQQIDYLTKLKDGFKTEGGAAAGIVGALKDRIKSLKDEIDQAPTFSALVQLSKKLEDAELKAKRLEGQIQRAIHPAGTITPMQSKTATSIGTPTPSGSGGMVGLVGMGPEPLDQGIFNEYMQQMDEMAAKAQYVGGVIANSLSDMAVNVGEAIGQMLMGTIDGTQLLDQLIASLGQFLGNLGKALIGVGMGSIAFKKSLSNPYTTIAAGIALVALGEIFKSTMQSGVNSFASGGVAVGPQLAMIGDNPGRKEAIIPSELWGEMGRGGQQVVALETQIRGTDIYLINKRITERREKYT